MGNESSKPKSANGSGATTPNADNRKSLDGGLQKFPSFSKTETTDSRRSFSGGLSGLRSKIPSRLKADSPRGSISASDVEERKDSLSVKSFRSRSKSPLRRSLASAISDDDEESSKPGSAVTSRPGSSSAETLTDNEGRKGSAATDKLDVPQPPPSPTQSNSLGKGHESITKAQQSGEVDAVSEAGPSGSLHPSSNQQPKASILKQTETKKINPDDPISFFRLIGSADREPAASSPGMSIGKIKPIDLDDMINRLLDAGYNTKATKAVCLKNAEITAVCTAVREVLLSQPTLLELGQPVKIVGDIHGQYVDLLRTFEMCGFPPQANYLFLGDYVDRGKKSLETILLLFCYKLKFPENFFLLRGNHESANVTRVYGFYDECKRRTNIKIWKTFIDAFNCLPIAAVVANKIFCVHGGLSPSLHHMEDIKRIKRPTDVPEYGLLNDLLWSDPADMESDWEANERGVSYCFGKKVIQEFLNKNDFDLVCRAHMVVEDGYEFFQDRVLVTVFSAPNYCGEFDNWGAVMSVNDELLCSFELLKPLDSSALKSHLKKSRMKQTAMLNSPPAMVSAQSF